MNGKFTKNITTKGVDLVRLLGQNDVNLRTIERKFADSKIIVRGDQIRLEGANERELENLDHIFSELIFLVGRNGIVESQDVETVIRATSFANASPAEIKSSKDVNGVVLFTKDGFIKSKSKGQEEYIQAVHENDIVFSIGPAGTGKTYLAVAMAVSSLRNKEVTRIVLARPAVEAGESLGFLPGDLRDKVDPYLRPLYDALMDMIPRDILKRYFEQEVIEVIPLAYMRGRTLNNAFVILDEAQNSSTMQMKMFLTRLGINSKAVITGDITQIDLPDRKNSGLLQIQNVLKGIEGIRFVYLTESDVVRHRLVKKIIQAYSAYHELNGLEE